MTSVTDIYNRALQQAGTRTTVTDAEVAANSTNEAIQLNLIYENTRDDLARMAPWNCAFNYANLVYITSTPGTPENTSAATQTWQKGQPPPPWAYEYQYPVDCLRACFVVPSTQTGFSSGVPITTAVTGGAPSFWLGTPVRFKVAIDQFYPVTAAVVAAGGSGYVVGDYITLASGASGAAPIGAPVVLRVATLGGGGAVATVTVVNQIAGEATSKGGSYFLPQTNPVAQGSTTGVGTGATFNLTFGSQGDQRVILTNQEFATLAYCKQVTDPNVWDTLFQSAVISILAANIAYALLGDRGRANDLIGIANRDIENARGQDGNEGLTINDVTPDFIRVRGINYSEYYSGPYSQYEWGAYWPMY